MLSDEALIAVNQKWIYRLTNMIQKDLYRLYRKCKDSQLISKLANKLSIDDNLKIYIKRVTQVFISTSYPLYRKVAEPLLKRKLNIKYPCILCNSISNKRLCKPCHYQFFQSSQYQCTCCALPLLHSAIFCGECLKIRPHFNHTVSPYLYQKPLSTLLFHFKQQGDFYTGKALSELFSQKIKQYYLQQHRPYPDLITPMPQHWKKQRERGFNHTVFFAHDISKKMRIPIFKNVKRIKGGLEQKELNRKTRLKNLQNSFSISQSLNGEHIAIIDDVMTTGATANALAETLKKAGAGQVTIWVLSRTPKER